jgi:cell division protein FtsB
VYALRGPQGVSGLYEKRKEIEELQEQNATLSKEVQEKKDRIQQLKNNPAAQEEEIRRRYKLLKPGETTFILPDAPKTATESAPKN